MKKICIIFILLIILLSSCQTVTVESHQNAEISKLLLFTVDMDKKNFSSIKESKNFDDGLFEGDFNKIFFTCVDILDDEEYPVLTQRKDDGVIITALKNSSDVDVRFYIKCEVREMSKGLYKLKWKLYRQTAFEHEFNKIVKNAEVKMADEDYQVFINQQLNNLVFCLLKGLNCKRNEVK